MKVIFLPASPQKFETLLSPPLDRSGLYFQNIESHARLKLWKMFESRQGLVHILKFLNLSYF